MRKLVPKLPVRWRRVPPSTVIFTGSASQISSERPTQNQPNLPCHNRHSSASRHAAPRCIRFSRDFPIWLLINMLRSRYR